MKEIKIHPGLSDKMLQADKEKASEHIQEFKDNGYQKAVEAVEKFVAHKRRNRHSQEFSITKVEGNLIEVERWGSGSIQFHFSSNEPKVYISSGMMETRVINDPNAVSAGIEAILHFSEMFSKAMEDWEL